MSGERTYVAPQPPSPGRIVLYFFRGPDQTVRNRPAIVTSIVDVDMINLHVFFEPGDQVNDPYAMSVSAHAEGPNGPFHAHTWSWPPRV